MEQQLLSRFPVTNNTNERLAGEIGVSAAARQILGHNHFTADDETFFLEHYAELSWWQLLGWLCIPEPDPEDRKRPGASIAGRIAASWAEHNTGLEFTEIAPLTEALPDQAVRNEVIVALKGVMGDDHWPRVALLASGGEVFAKIRDVERRVQDSKLRLPFDLLEEGAMPFLTAKLFVGSRQDGDVLPVLHDMLGEEPLRYYCAWVLREAGLLGRFAADDVLGDVTLPDAVISKEASRYRFLTELARDWPDKSARAAWFTKRTLDQVARGKSWLRLWWEIPPDLRDNIAVASLAMSEPAPWAWRAVTTSLSGREAWEAAFDLVDRRLPPLDNDEFNAALGGAFHAFGQRPKAGEIDEFFKAVATESRLAWLSKLDLPSDADDTFDGRYLELAKQFGHYESEAIHRLRALPLTKSRARRIASYAIEHGLLWHLDGLLEVATAAGHLDMELELPSYVSVEMVTAFKTLVGERADAVLAERVASLIEHGEVEEALSLADAARDIVTPALHERLKTLARAQPIAMQAHIQKRAPWLMTEADVVASASEAGAHPWGLPDLLPAYLEPVISARAVTTEHAELAQSLLERLEALGTPKSKVMDLALERLRACGPGSLTPWWLAKRLDSRSAWDGAGMQLARDLINRGVEGADALLGICLQVAVGAGTELGPLPRAMHTAVGAALVGVGHQALAAGDQRRAKKALTGLAHLNPRSELRGRVRALRGAAPAPDVLSVIEINDNVMRRSGNKDAATVDAIRDALIALFRDEDAEDGS